MGYNVTAHGFRSTFREFAAKRTRFPSEVAEMDGTRDEEQRRTGVSPRRAVRAPPAQDGGMVGVLCPGQSPALAA